MNVVTGVSRLGLHGVILAALGEDKLGSDFIELLKTRGVNVEGVQTIPGRKTRDILVTRTSDGDRTFAGFGSESSSYADCFIEADKLPEHLIKEAAVVVSGTLGLVFPGSAAAMRRTVQLGKESGATVIVDVNWRPVFWLDTHSEEESRATILEYLKIADIVKVTDEEAEFLWGIPAKRALEHPEEVLAKATDAKAVLVSAGEFGSAYAFRTPGGKQDVSGHVGVFKIKVADTTGAGDAFLAGFIYFCLKAGGLQALVADPDKALEAVRFATACGAFTCTGPGAIGSQPTPADAEKLLADNP